MKRYVVTEEQLKDIKDLLYRNTPGSIAGTNGFDDLRRIQVPYWATHFSGEIQDAGGWVDARQEIPK